MLTVATKFLTTMQEMLNPLRDDAAEAAYQIDDIRQAMLDSLDSDARLDFPMLERRILQASSAPSLWFLRPDLLTALANSSGEQAAYKAVGEISDMFDGLLPQSMKARPSMAARR